MFKNFSFKTRLLLLCFQLCAVSLAVGVVGYVALDKVTDEFQHVAEKTIPKTELVYQMFLEFREIRINMKSLDSKSLDSSRVNASIENINEHFKKYDQLRKSYGAMGFIAGQKELVANIDEVWKDYEADAVNAIELYGSSQSSDQDNLRLFFTKQAPLRAKSYQQAIEKLLSFHDGNVKERINNSENLANQATQILIGVIVVGSLLGLLVGFLFARSFSQSLTAVAHGLNEGANLVDQTATSIASASDQLAAGATEQAAALQETTASLEETSAMVSKNADNARRSTEVSGESQETVAQGKAAVEEMIQSIDEISKSNVQVMNQIDESNREIEAIVRVIGEIGTKTKIINDIVFQTKLLSFNASVEAARAGEHGKGFAVVAEEVGKLAQMSGSAAKEITDMPDESMRKVEQIVANTKTRVSGLMTVSQGKVQAGIITAKKCETLLEAIVHDVNHVGTMIVEISSASEEQAKGVQEINKAMTQLDTVSQQNSAASGLAANSAQVLRSEVQQLRTMVEQLNLALNGTPSTNRENQRSSSDAGASSRHASGGRNSSAKVLNYQPKSAPAPRAAKTQEVANGISIPLANDPRFEDI